MSTQEQFLSGTRAQAILMGACDDYAPVARAAVALLNAVPHTDTLDVRAATGDDDLTGTGQLTVPVVVAPSTAHGLHRASARIVTWRPDVERPVLLVVRDAPLPPPAVVVHRTTALAERVRLSVEIPYLPQLRELDDPAELFHPTRTSRGRARSARHAARVLLALRRQLLGAATLVLNTPRTVTPIDLPSTVPGA